MKKTLLIIMALAGLFLSASEAYAYDIVAENIYGVKVYYNYINDGTELEVTSGDAKYSGQVFIPKEVTHHEKTLKVTSIGDNAFWACRDLTSAIIPDGVTSIGDNAFQYCESIVSAILPISLKSIGKGSFTKCTALSYVSMPSSVKSIGDAAFANCTNLSSIKLPDNLTSIGGALFYGCRSLTDMIIPNGVTSIGETAFLGCSGLTTINIPDGVTSIGGGAFESCRNLTSVTLPNSVTSIADNAFQGCSLLTSIVIPEGVTSIANCLFYGCSALNSVNIPQNVTAIGYNAFCGCRSLTSITIPNSVTSIGASAFEYCINLTSIIIPSNVSFMGSWVFSKCSGLTSIISLIENPFAIIGKESEFTTFDVDIFNKVILYVPKGTVDKYKATEGWKDFVNIKEIDEEILDYHPLVVEGKEWHMLYNNTEASDIYPDYEFCYFIKGDTIISGLSCKKLYVYNKDNDQSTDYIMALIEADGKVLFIPKGSQKTYILYDFNIPIGKTTIINDAIHPEWMIKISNNEDSFISINGINRHCFLVNRVADSDGDTIMDFPCGFWIEGIGSELGPLNTWLFGASGNNNFLLYCDVNGQRVFTQSEFKENSTGIQVSNSRKERDISFPTYTIAGHITPSDAIKGIYIKNGKKYIKK